MVRMIWLVLLVVIGNIFGSQILKPPIYPDMLNQASAPKLDTKICSSQSNNVFLIIHL
jgi:hypothetical protein